MSHMATAPAKLSGRGRPVREDDDVALEGAGTKLYAISRTPHLAPDRFAGKYRGGEAHTHGYETRWIVVAIGPQDRVSGDPESSETVKDRAWKSGGLCDRRRSLRTAPVRDYDPEYTAPAEWTLLLIEFTPRFCAHDPTVYVPAGTLPEPFAAP